MDAHSGLLRRRYSFNALATAYQQLYENAARGAIES